MPALMVFESLFFFLAHALIRQRSGDAPQKKAQKIQKFQLCSVLFEDIEDAFHDFPIRFHKTFPMKNMKTSVSVCTQSIHPYYPMWSIRHN